MVNNNTGTVGMVEHQSLLGTDVRQQVSFWASFDLPSGFDTNKIDEIRNAWSQALQEITETYDVTIDQARVQFGATSDLGGYAS